MRFRRLDITRYGAFCDRSLDFGGSDRDLHLVVGANEAGKSTMLSAIGDLLWGMGERPPYAFRFPYGELRLGGIVEHAGASLEFLRRKARTASLMTPDEGPLPDSSLAAYLGGLDRDGFDRMFGLNHDRLRAGGQAMLAGREDVARVLFEAGTGLTGVNAILSSLENEANEIFGRTTRTKPLNTALKERETNLAATRTSAMAPSKWKSIARRLETAEREHAEALLRTSDLEHRRSVLERIERARPILAKIDVRLDELAALGTIPSLPANAADVRVASSSTMAEKTIAIGEKINIIDANERDLLDLSGPSPIIPHEKEIVRLADGLLLHRNNLADLPAAESRAESAKASRERILNEAGLAAGFQMPSNAALTKARDAIDALSASQDAFLGFEAASLIARRNLEAAKTDMAGQADVSGLAALRSALAAAPRDGVKIAAQNEELLAAAQKRSARINAQLHPWTGEVDDLSLAVVPSAEVIETNRGVFAAIAEDRASHDDLLTSTTDALIEARAELVRLTNLDREPPTPQNVAEARNSRDATIAALVEPPERCAITLAEAQAQVRAADELADRREAEANRIADHARALSAIVRAEAKLADGPARLARIDGRLIVAEADWRPIWSAAGFTSAVTPQQMSSWSEARRLALDAADALFDRVAASTSHHDGLAEHLKSLIAAMRACGTEPATPLDLDALISDASTLQDALLKDRDSSLLAATRLKDAEGGFVEAATSLAESAAERDKLARDVPTALAPLHLDHLDVREAKTAITALDAVAARQEGDDEIEVRAQSLGRSVAEFEGEVRSLASVLGNAPPEDTATFLLALRSELDVAKQTERDRDRLTASTAKTQSEIATLEAISSLARINLEGVMAAAGVTDVKGLDAVIERRTREQRLLVEVSELRDELADTVGGVSEESVRAEVDGSQPEIVASDLALIKRTQQEMIGTISTLSAELSAAQAEEREATNGAGAADAAQAAETARATIVDLSTRYIRSKSAAAMLRWAINRHRETRQAPLLARAGEIMASVTGGRFSGLALDWTQGEQPVIVGQRNGGNPCGVNDMSEGTRDQLFLALRLAAIEEKAADHSMPLICDDLFITADDARSARLFTQMKKLSSTTQVIIFTHHDHLEAVANDALGADAYSIHRIHPV